MKRTIAVVLLVLAASLIAQAETITVKGVVEKSKGGSRSFVLKNPSISVMGGSLFTDPGVQSQLEAYEGKEVQITGDVYKRPAGYSAIKSIDKITADGEEAGE